MSLRGLCIPTGQLIGAGILRDLRDLGCNGIRIKADGFVVDGRLERVPTPPETWAMAQEVIDAGMQPYVSIRSAEQLAVLQSNANVGLGNEPNLSINGWTKESYRREADRCVAMAADMGRRIYLGCVSNTHVEAFRWLQSVWNPEWKDKSSAFVGGDIHHYPDPGRPLQPHSGFSSWGHVVRRWREIVGNVPLLIGEDGFNCIDFTEAQQAEYQPAMAANWAPYVDWFFAYGLLDGPDPNSKAHDDHYGFMTADGRRKPVMTSFFQAG